jgi:hypothetical protein
VAAPTKKRAKQSLSKRPDVQLAAIRLLGAGKTRAAVADILAPHVYPQIFPQDPREAKRRVRKKIRMWEETQWFRDAVYDSALADLDADLPQILKGMGKRARRRVDAARLALEVTGRHNPRGEQAAPTAIQINFGGALPRPGNRPQIEAVDGEVVAEEDDDAI